MQQQIDIDHSRLRPAHRVPRFATLRTVAALILREIGTTNGRRPGGYLWTILEPIGGILAMTLLFSLFLRTPPLGSSFAFFYATGMIPFLIFTKISNKLASALSYSKQLLTYPRVTIMDALIARLIMNITPDSSTSGLVMIDHMPFQTGMAESSRQFRIPHPAPRLIASAWASTIFPIMNVVPVSTTSRIPISVSALIESWVNVFRISRASSASMIVTRG